MHSINSRPKYNSTHQLRRAKGAVVPVQRVASARPAGSRTDAAVACCTNKVLFVGLQQSDHVSRRRLGFSLRGIGPSDLQHIHMRSDTQATGQNSANPAIRPSVSSGIDAVYNCMKHRRNSLRRHMAQNGDTVSSSRKGKMIWLRGYRRLLQHRLR